MNRDNSATATPPVGILGWEAGDQVTLSQLEQLPGDIAHPDTFAFEVWYHRVQGAHYETVVVRPNRQVLAAMIAAAQELEAAGVRFIMTNCGFNAIFQAELADAVEVPLVASSLIQVPLVARTLRRGQEVGVLTADREHLTADHLAGAGISPTTPLRVLGVEQTGEFSRVRTDPEARLDPRRFEQEVLGVARQLVEQSPDLGAMVLECTDLPPVAAAIRRELRLPVFDIVTLAHMVHEALLGDRWGPAASGKPRA